MIQGEEDYWIAPNGTRYEVGEVVPVLRLAEAVLFNEKIVKGSCDMCDWAIIGPETIVASWSHAHVETHIMKELADEFKHPDFTE